MHDKQAALLPYTGNRRKSAQGRRRNRRADTLFCSSWQKWKKNTLSPSMSEETGSPASSSISIYIPIVYVVVLLTTLVLFSVAHRRKKLSKLVSMKPIFKDNYQREMYLQLKNQTEPKVNDKVLKAALIRRGAEAIRRMIKLKEIQQYVNVLYQRGSIGDDVYESFKLQSKLQELELNELAMEAESFKKGWAQTFFPVCQEVTINEALRRRLNSLEPMKESLDHQWLKQVAA
ncbi:hypothetical protein KL920_004365 [Ogataea angusta]|nr:hypothetical protein KL920_004365 [Ogataea angusta]